MWVKTGFKRKRNGECGLWKVCMLNEGWREEGDRRNGMKIVQVAKRWTFNCSSEQEHEREASCVHVKRTSKIRRRLPVDKIRLFIGGKLQQNHHLRALKLAVFLTCKISKPPGTYARKRLLWARSDEGKQSPLLAASFSFSPLSLLCISVVRCEHFLTPRLNLPFRVCALEDRWVDVWSTALPMVEEMY